MITPLIIATVVVVVAVLFVIAVSTRPDTFRISRSASIAAPPSAVFPHVNDFHKWGPWSPFEKRDPAMKKTYDGPPSGTGASQSWSGNLKGRVSITESRANDLVRIKLEFFKPWYCSHDVEFIFKPEGNQTNVTWSMAGRCNLLVKTMCLFVSMDSMCGKDLDRGLAQLKTVTESGQRQEPSLSRG